MAMSLEIEALNLEIRDPVQKEFCTQKFGLFSQPEISLKNIGGVDLRYDPQIDLRKEEDACVASNVLLNLIGRIPPSPKNALSEKTSIIPSDQVPPQGVKDAIMQACNNIDLNKAKICAGSIRHDLADGTEKDHLVPENGLKWENDQESIDDMWNEMSSGQNKAMKFQNIAKSANLVSNLLQNDNSPRPIQNENDEFNFSLSCPSSPEEFEGSNDLFSQMYQMNVQSKKKKIIHFGRPKLLGPDSIMLSQVCSGTKFSVGQTTSQIDTRDAFERIADITFGISQKITQNEYEESLTTQKNKSQVFFSQNYEENAFECIDEMALAECSTGNLGEFKKEIDIGSVVTGPSGSQAISCSQNDEQVSFEKNSAETSDMFDEEIDAAIDNYIVHSQRKAPEFGSQSFRTNRGHPQELETCFEAKIDAGTQTIISGSIYASSNKCNCAKSSTLKRTLQALCLENVVCKKSKTVILSSPNVFLTNQQVTKWMNESWDSYKGEYNLDASQHLGKLSSGSLAASDTEKNTKPSPLNIEKSEQSDKEGNYFINKMEQDESDGETELQDQEVPRSVVIGTLQIHPPANFCWEKDRQEPVENDVNDAVDSGTLSKPKTPCRLRLGLSRRAKPRLSLHRAP